MAYVVLSSRGWSNVMMSWFFFDSMSNSLPIAGVIRSSSFGLFRKIGSEHVSSIELLLKFIWPALGIDVMSVGGMLSLGPPVGAVCLAHESANRTNRK